ncbi:MAG TPA: Rieske 2Fe-2S domain-containing protein [Methylomirabilota bacterium]
MGIRLLWRDRWTPPPYWAGPGSVKARPDRAAIMGAVSRLVRVASAGEIPIGRGKSVEVDGIPLAVFHVDDGQYQALEGSCPHEGGPLGDGVLLGDRVVCPWHGFDFDVRTGACNVAPDLAVTVYPVWVAGSDVLVELP